MSGQQASPFLQFLEAGIARGGFETDDVLSALLPLSRQVLAAHAAGKMAPLEGIAELNVSEAGHLLFASEKLKSPAKNSGRVEEFQVSLRRHRQPRIPAGNVWPGPGKRAEPSTQKPPGLLLPGHRRDGEYC